jgi:Oxidoreductase-like protein, N-terminal
LQRFLKNINFTIFAKISKKYKFYDFIVKSLASTSNIASTATTAGTTSHTKLTSHNTTKPTNSSKPVMPTDCCMSGCKVCVFDEFHKRVQDWNLLNPLDLVENDLGMDAFQEMERDLIKRRGL